ncbi:hypothetical protein BC938DRAFT_482272, partial [Jimgerdemannia flammicorona]
TAPAQTTPAQTTPAQTTPAQTTPARPPRGQGAPPGRNLDTHAIPAVLFAVVDDGGGVAFVRFADDGAYDVSGTV